MRAIALLVLGALAGALSPTLVAPVAVATLCALGMYAVAAMAHAESDHRRRHP